MVASKHCIVPILPLYASLLYNLGYQISADAVRGVCALESSSCDCTRYCNTLRNYARVYVCLISSFDESTLDPRLFFLFMAEWEKREPDTHCLHVHQNSQKS